MKRLVPLAARLLAGASAARALEVVIVKPNPGEAMFGATTVAAEIYPIDAEVERLEFFLDGFLVGERREPPWEVLIDAGQGNEAHLVEVVAYGADGETASSQLTTATVRVDDEVDVNLRQLYISFDDPVLAGDYGRDDFEVLDAGARQEIVTFESGDAPFSAVLLLDA